MVRSGKRLFPLIFLMLSFYGIAKADSRRTVLYRFKFGSVDQRPLTGYQPVSRLYSSDHFMWIGPVINRETTLVSSPILQEFLTGPAGEFLVGLSDGDYKISLTMSDAGAAHGPFAVKLQDVVVDPAIYVAARAVVRRQYAVHVSGGRFRLRFEASLGQSFVVNAMTIAGPLNARKLRLFESAPPDALPSTSEVMRGPALDAKAALRNYADWLVDHRLPNGFIGDVEFSGGRQHPYWYTSSFPLRTLLAAYEILHERKYLDTATALLDELVAEQLPNGGFQQAFRGRPTSDLSASDIDRIVHHEWMNMADVGSIVMALGQSIHDVSNEAKQGDATSSKRAAAYTLALQRYCDDWAQPFQLPTGAFTNGVESGIRQTAPYSVATATEAGAFAVAYGVTHEERYRTTARRAADFLIENWLTDGRPLTIRTLLNVLESSTPRNSRNSAIPSTTTMDCWRPMASLTMLNCKPGF